MKMRKAPAQLMLLLEVTMLPSQLLALVLKNRPVIKHMLWQVLEYNFNFQCPYVIVGIF